MTLHLQLAAGARATRSRTLAYATDDASAIVAAARDLLAGAPPDARGIAVAGIAVANLGGAGGAGRLALPIAPSSSVEGRRA